MPTSMAMARQASGGFNPLSLTDTVFLCVSTDATAQNGASGSGTGTISGSAPTMTFTASGIQGYHVGGTLTISGATTPGNNGSFTILTAGAGTCTYSNASGAAESIPGGGSWSILGQVASIIDRKNGFEFTPLNGTTNAYSLNTSIFPGKRVLATGSTLLRYMLRNNTDAAGLVNGLTPITVFTYFNPVTFPGGTIAYLQTRDQPGGTTPSSAMYARYVTAAGSKDLNRRTSAGNSTTYPTTFSLTTNAWQSMCLAYDGNTGIEWYVNGVSQGTATASPTRSLSSQQTILWGSLNDSTTPAGGAQQQVGVMALYTQRLSAGTIANMHAWAVAQF